MIPESLLDMPLDGFITVEGPAGSGKTQGVSELLLRLLVEQQHTPAGVLVLTPLADAADRLQTHLHTRLAMLMAGGAANPDPLLQRWQQRYADQATLRERLQALPQEWLSLPVMGFDKFCSWVLEVCGWGVGVVPGTYETLGWERDLNGQVASLWQQDCQGFSSLLAEFLHGDLIDAAVLSQQIRPFVGRDLQPLAPRVDDLPDLEQDYQSYFKAFSQDWREGGRERCVGQRGSRVLMDRCCAGMVILNMPSLPGKLPADDPLITAWERLNHARDALRLGYQRWLAWYRGDLLRRCDALGRARRRQGVLYSLEDRTLLLVEQLNGPRGEHLAAAIRRRLPALIWDDCQQGSRLQHEIIRRIYADTGLTAILLGDPCQSSDRFGRADVFAHLEQCRRADRRLRLDTSYHCHPGLGRMVTELFQRATLPFGVDLGGAGPASQHRGTAPALQLQGDTEAAMRCWWLGDDDGQAWRPVEAHEQATQACAGEIARLLNLARQGQAWLGERPLDANDIVVLVNNLSQAQRMHGALLRLGVPGVRIVQETVLRSREAEALERILLAAAEPWQEQRILVALATDLMGVDGAGLFALSQDAARRQDYLDAFRSYHELWRRHGFMRMFRSWLTEESVPRRLLQFRDGEQRLTNLLHLAELLQTTAVQSALGPEALCRWLRQRRLERGNDELSQSRLASDEPRVRVITVHLAQGQHFPVVFCPFAWEGTLDPGVAALFHDPDDGAQPQVDMGSAGLARHQRLAAQEALGLELRTLYLMLTRAHSLLCCCWGRIQGMGKTPLAWLLHPMPTGVAEPQERADYVESRSAEQLLEDLLALVEPAGGALRIEYPPEDISSFEPPERDQGELQFRHFSGPVQGRWRRWRWRELLGQGVQTPPEGGLHRLAPDTLPQLLQVLPERLIDDCDLLAGWLAEQSWTQPQILALVEPLQALLTVPRIADVALTTLLGSAQSRVPVCAALSTLDLQLADTLPRRGFLQDHIDWLVSWEGGYHAVFCCWDDWTEATPEAMNLAHWAALTRCVLETGLGICPGGVHFLFPTGMRQASADSGYWGCLYPLERNHD